MSEQRANFKRFFEGIADLVGRGELSAPEIDALMAAHGARTWVPRTLTKRIIDWFLCPSRRQIEHWVVKKNSATGRAS